ncbi:MAG: hypothetical protein QOC54_1573, partial [Baekduia sp.]|nr:hypothetical protein [Baekduia sp.]
MGVQAPAARAEVGDGGGRGAEREVQAPAGMQEHRAGVEVEAGLGAAREARRRQHRLGLRRRAAVQQDRDESGGRGRMAQGPALARSPAPRVAGEAFGRGEVAGPPCDVGPEGGQHGHLQRGVAGAAGGQRGLDVPRRGVEVVGRRQAPDGDRHGRRAQRLRVGRALQGGRGQRGHVVGALAGHRQLGGRGGELGGRGVVGVGRDAGRDGLGHRAGRPVRGGVLARLVDDVGFELLAQATVVDLGQGVEHRAEVALGIAGLREDGDERQRRLQALLQRAGGRDGRTQVHDRDVVAERGRLRDAQVDEHCRAVVARRRLGQRAQQQPDRDVGCAAVHRLAPGGDEHPPRPRIAVGLAGDEVGRHVLGRGVLAGQQLGGGAVQGGGGARRDGSPNPGADDASDERRLGAAIDQRGDAQDVGGGAALRAVESGEPAGARPRGARAEDRQRAGERDRLGVERRQAVGQPADERRGASGAGLAAPGHIGRQRGDVARQAGAGGVAGAAGRRRGAGRHRADEGDRRRLAERAEQHVAAPGRAVEHAPDGRARWSVVGGDDQHEGRFGGAARQRAEHAQRRLVGTLCVVEQEHHRPVRGHERDCRAPCGRLVEAARRDQVAEQRVHGGVGLAGLVRRRGPRPDRQPGVGRDRPRLLEQRRAPAARRPVDEHRSAPAVPRGGQRP